MLLDGHCDFIFVTIFCPFSVELILLVISRNNLIDCFRTFTPFLCIVIILRTVINYIQFYFPGIIFPRTTLFFAPVAEGMLPGFPLTVSLARIANANASFALEGMPKSSTFLTLISTR